MLSKHTPYLLFLDFDNKDNHVMKLTIILKLTNQYVKPYSFIHDVNF